VVSLRAPALVTCHRSTPNATAPASETGEYGASDAGNTEDDDDADADDGDVMDLLVSAGFRVDDDGVLDLDAVGESVASVMAGDDRTPVGPAPGPRTDLSTSAAEDDAGEA
jgi:hypothetical protein